MILAEIFNGERDTSDVFLLIAIVLFVVDAAMCFSTRPDPTRGGVRALRPLGLACVAFALMLL